MFDARFPFGPPDLQRHARLATLTPHDAVRTFIDGDFMIDEETALGFAIRQDAGITLADDALFDLLAPAMGTDADPEALLVRLRRASGQRRR